MNKAEILSEAKKFVESVKPANDCPTFPVVKLDKNLNWTKVEAATLHLSGGTVEVRSTSMVNYLSRSKYKLKL